VRNAAPRVIIEVCRTEREMPFFPTPFVNLHRTRFLLTLLRTTMCQELAFLDEHGRPPVGSG
jgi:hypothetical protein